MKPRQSSLAARANVTSDDSRWRLAAYAGCGILLLAIVLFALDAGSPWDEPSQAEYGDLVIRWFTSGLHDSSATRFENLYLYGGLFEAPAQLITRLSPIGAYETRHLLIALVGWVGVIGAGLIASEVAGRRAGVIAGAMLALTPQWIGHSWFNSKDIPFATAATLATWFAVRIAVRGLPPRPSDASGAGLAIGAALGIRSGGYFLFAYPLLACALGVVGNTNVAESSASSAVIRRLTVLRALGMIPIAWLVMIALWPWAWSAPLIGPLVAMRFASSFPFSGDTLFQGQLLKTTAVPASYLPTWFAITTPEYYIVALILGVGALVCRQSFSSKGWSTGALASDGTRNCCAKRKPNVRGVIVVCAAIALPFAAAVITKPAIYDGLRHFLFIFPMLAALAGIAVTMFLANDALPRLALAAGVTVLCTAALVTAGDVVSLHPYEYAYFNRSFGGLPAAQGRYETDFWGASYKEAFEWLVRQSQNSARPITVSSCNESSTRRLNYYRLQWSGVSDRVSILPPGSASDFFLESTRRYQCVPAEGTVIHTVGRSGVPLLYVRQTSSRP